MRETRAHNVRRTSPKGQKFIGTCVLCGRENMTIRESMETECENQRGRTADESLLEAINPKDN